jgi:hypothetical protein
MSEETYVEPLESATPITKEQYSRPRLYRIDFSFPVRFLMPCHSNYLGYTGLSYTGSSSVTSDFSALPPPHPPPG